MAYDWMLAPVLLVPKSRYARLPRQVLQRLLLTLVVLAPLRQSSRQGFRQRDNV